MSDPPRIILVEDEPFQRAAVQHYLARHGLEVLGAADGQALRALVAEAMPDIVLLDVRLPGEDGFALARWLRGLSDRMGILMLTAAGETLDRVIGLESGADDYLPKPFEPREMLARLRALLRRAERSPRPASAAPALLRLHDGVLDLGRGVIQRDDGREEALSAAELTAIRMLAAAAGQPVSRAALAGGEGGDRAADLRVMRLRRRMEEDPARPRLILTCRGQGYSLGTG